MKAALLLLTTLAVCATGTWSQENYKFVCYFPNWSNSRHGIGKYGIEDIDPSVCTHLVYAFASLNENTYEMEAQNPSVDIDMQYYERFTALKAQNPQLKTLLSLGGWVDSQSPKYSQLVADPQRVANFVTKAVDFLAQYNFDGLDVDWEYPGVEDKENFGRFIAALSEAFKPRGLLLTVAASASIKTMEEGYDVPVLGANIDLLHLMAYDFHGSWEPEISDHHAPLKRRSYQSDDLDADTAVRAWLDRGFPASKIVLGVPFYGRSWTLSDLTNVNPPAPAVGPGQAGAFTREEGFKAFYEIGLDIQAGGLIVVQDPEQKMGPYAYGGENQWIGYDDVPTVRQKTRYMKEMGLGGIMVWEVSLDDFKNALGTGANPLLSAIHSELYDQ